MLRRNVIGVLIGGALAPAVSREGWPYRPVEIEIEGFSPFAGPDIIKELVVGKVLAVVPGLQSHGVFDGKEQIGYVQRARDGATVCRAMKLIRISRASDGRRRAWAISS